MKKRICMVVQDPMVKGGIAAVVNGYRGSKLEADYDITYVESYKDGGKAAKLLKALCGYMSFVKVLLFNKPDIVHIHSSFGPSFFRKIPFIYMASWAKIPIINHIHGAEFDEFYLHANDKKKRLIKKTYLKCTKLIALSQEWKENLSLIVPEDKIEIIENYSMVNYPAFDEKIKRKSNNTVLFLGELGKRKGCYDIAQTALTVSQKIPNVKFILAGSGTPEDEGNIKKSFMDLKIQDLVEFTGWVRDKEKDELLRKSDIFFLPSYNEGMPMSILDAMGYGLPIVSTNVGGIPKIVKNEENGYTVKAGDIDGFANAIISILSDDEKRKNFSRNSYDVASSKYSLDKHIEEIERVYENL